MRRRWLRLVLSAMLVALLLFGTWLAWTEANPERERELRTAAQDQLTEWFPEAMNAPELFGFQPPDTDTGRSAPDLVLIHGLDEPGGIWDAALEAFAAAGLAAWEFRYPNDQAIDRSADLLAEYWSGLGDPDPVILIGHSMGGLVIRDFVTRWRHPAESEPDVGGPPVRGVVLVGTPNQGSAWARLRAWLEVREWLAQIPEGQLSLFTGLRQGTGAAKIDLRPDSRFLTDLNARPWPDAVPIQIIGGQLGEATPETLQGLDRLSEDLGVADLRARVEAWWAETGEGLGDGVVPVDSLSFDGGPEPLLLQASHRGLLVEQPLADGPPPAIEPMLETIRRWRESE